MSGQQSDIEEILSRRDDNGADYWATPDGRIYVGNPFSTIGSLGLLHELGLKSDHEEWTRSTGPSEAGGVGEFPTSRLATPRRSWSDLDRYVWFRLWRFLRRRQGPRGRLHPAGFAEWERRSGLAYFYPPWTEWVYSLACRKVNVVGKPYEGKPHVRFDVAGGGNRIFRCQAPPPDPTCGRRPRNAHAAPLNPDVRRQERSHDGSAASS